MKHFFFRLESKGHICLSARIEEERVAKGKSG